MDNTPLYRREPPLLGRVSFEIENLSLATDSRRNYGSLRGLSLVSQQTLNDTSMDVGESIVSTLEAIRQTGVIET